MKRNVVEKKDEDKKGEDKKRRGKRKRNIEKSDRTDKWLRCIKTWKRLIRLAMNESFYNYLFGS